MVPNLGREVDGLGPCLANTRGDSLGAYRWERVKGGGVGGGTPG